MCNGVAIQLSNFPSKDESKVKVAYLVLRPFFSHLDRKPRTGRANSINRTLLDRDFWSDNKTKKECPRIPRRSQEKSKRDNRVLLCSIERDLRLRLRLIDSVWLVQWRSPPLLWVFRKSFHSFFFWTKSWWTAFPLSRTSSYLDWCLSWSRSVFLLSDLLGTVFAMESATDEVCSKTHATLHASLTFFSLSLRLSWEGIKESK